MSRVVDSAAAVCFFLVALLLACGLTFGSLLRDLWRSLGNIWHD